MSNELLKCPVVCGLDGRKDSAEEKDNEDVGDECGNCDMTGRLLNCDPIPMVVDCVKGGAGYIVLPDEAVSFASVISLFKYVITGYHRKVIE